LVKNDSVRMTENSKLVFGCRNARFMKQFVLLRRSYKPVNLAHLNSKWGRAQHRNGIAILCWARIGCAGNTCSSL